MLDGVSLILPAYNEAENLKLILPEIIHYLSMLNCSYEILVIDTINNMDDTKEVCKDYGVRYINRENGNTYGDAIRTGIKYINYSKTIIMDCDHSHNPSDILKLYNALDSNIDICIGSRYVSGGYTDNSFVLKILSVLCNFIFKLLFHLTVKDISNSFRIYRTDLLKNINIECNNFDLVEEILIKIIRNKKDVKIVEVPINFNKRKFGVSKRQLVAFTFSYLNTIVKLLK